MRSSDTGNWDVIVVGGGHNGLAAAALLAKSGRRVCVLEADDEVGGGARARQLAPKFRTSSLAHVLNRLDAELIRTLDLESHGLELGGAPMPTVALGKGDPLILHGAYGKTVTGLGEAEGRAWTELRRRLMLQAGVLKPFLARRPPQLDTLTLGEKGVLGGAALSLKRLGKDEMRAFLRMVLMNVADVADECLDDDRLKGLLAFDATLGSHLGPRSPTSLLGLYYRLAGEIEAKPGAQTVPKGGMGAVVASLASAAERAGATLRTKAGVGRILVEAGRAVGVVLEGGETLRALTIVSAMNPRTTMLDLVGARALDIGLVRKLTHIRMKGDVAKLDLALDRPPTFTGVDEDALSGRLVIARSSDDVERAFNPAKYGEFSREPVMEIVLPSLHDPSLAPDGACVLSAVVQYAPYDLKEGWETGKPKFLEAVLGRLEAHAPGLRESILRSELLTPADIEARYRMPGGHWHHGELQADQMLFSRPVSGMSGYDTPIDGLYLAGAGSHPGGGISGRPAMNAVRHILAAEKR
ncbi:phytoene desaturase family protein [Pararhizobium mangrovi]|uniref:Pyridine nucleotide-disulfide oxidoreductase domain-containing protein 2 n=1 Tax=Pararhizobium mangrovi TaxID=2590452 RepID=A0A506U362_9HYPH|nr:NAD(P)/FAD-dependent oxidoreductase [Pararhizobium mangrovi]TPW27435.1 NAD(P)/FAD-dependent oxidoreductase [Pararhizobium mangrovi]